VIGFKRVLYFIRRAVTYIRPTKEVVAYIKKWLQEKRPFLRAYTWSTEKLDNLGLQPPQYKDLGLAGAYQLIRVF